MLSLAASASAYDPGGHFGDDGWLLLHRNENLFAGPEWSVETARRLVESACLTRFPDPRSEALRAALGERHGVGPERVFVGNGSDEVLSDLFMLLRRSYERVSLLDVGFRIYLLLAERFGFAVDRLPGRTFTSGRVETDGFRGLAVVDSPNSITSARLPAETLSELARDGRSFVVWDGAYGDYCGDAVPRPLPSNVVVVRTFSKFYALAGLRIGYCIGEPSLVSELLARKDTFNVNAFAQVMAKEALLRHDEFAALANEMRASRAALVDGLSTRGFRVHEPAANFVLATHPEIPGARLESELASRRVAVRRFPAEPTVDHVRIGVPPMAGVRRLLDTLDELRSHT